MGRGLWTSGKRKASTEVTVQLSGNDVGRDKEGGSILRTVGFWKGAWQCRMVPSLSICEGPRRLILNLDSWSYPRDADSTGAPWERSQMRGKM